MCTGTQPPAKPPCLAGCSPRSWKGLRGPRVLPKGMRSVNAASGTLCSCQPPVISVPRLIATALLKARSIGFAHFFWSRSLKRRRSAIAPADVLHKEQFCMEMSFPRRANLWVMAHALDRAIMDGDGLMAGTCYFRAVNNYRPHSATAAIRNVSFWGLDQGAKERVALAQRTQTLNAQISRLSTTLGSSRPGLLPAAPTGEFGRSTSG